MVMAFIFGSFVLAVSALSVDAQNVNEEYREWQRAQRQAQEEYRDWQRTRRATDRRDWQQAQRRAQREYLEYQRAGRMNNAGNGIGYGYGRARANDRYRVYRNGRYYSTDQRGAELLQRAVNLGYQRGFQSGQEDRRYGNRYGYNDERTYRSGTHGYQSYVARDQYQYYFQQGFQRGYEDGYNQQARYGYQSGNNWNILGTVLNSILNLTQY